MKAMLWSAGLGLLLLLTGVFIGWRFARDRADAWRVRAQLVLADSSRVAAENAALVYRADSLARSVADYADRVARQEARVAVAKRDADSAKDALLQYRDSVRTTGEARVPVAQLDAAIEVIARQDTVIAAQAEGIALRDRQIQAGAELRRVVEGERDLWKGRAGELEQVLIDLKPPPRPRWLGVLPAPSPTVAFLVGATAGLLLH